MRTARWRISGEKRFDFLFMAPSSQSLEPPQNPGRFSSAFGLFTIGIFYDALDPSKFEKKNAQNLYTHRMNDFYTDVAVFLTYFEKVAPLIENASSREDLKKIGMELRKLKAKYRYCEK